MLIRAIVTHVGPLAFAFEEDRVLVLFGSKAPNELRDISIIHEFSVDRTDWLSTDSRIIFDGTPYQVVAFGTQAAQNFRELGHISVYFSDPEDNVLPGAIYVKPHVLPNVHVGSVIEIRKELE